MSTSRRLFLASLAGGVLAAKTPKLLTSGPTEPVCSLEAEFDAVLRRLLAGHNLIGVRNYLQSKGLDVSSVVSRALSPGFELLTIIASKGEETLQVASKTLWFARRGEVSLIMVNVQNQVVMFYSSGAEELIIRRELLPVNIMLTANIVREAICSSPEFFRKVTNISQDHFAVLMGVPVTPFSSTPWPMEYVSLQRYVDHLIHNV